MTSTSMSESKPVSQGLSFALGRRTAVWGIWGVFLVLGLVGMYQRLTTGHLMAGYGSYVPWGLWIAVYFHGVGIAGGAFAVASLGHMLRFPGFRDAAVLRVAVVLACAAVMPALVGVWLDLGHMERVYRIITAPNFTSMMAFNAWIYSVFLGVAAITWLLSFKQDSGWLKPFLILGLFLSAIIPSQSGAFFGVVDAKPYWHNPLMPLLFLASAMTAGTAMLLVVLGLPSVRSFVRGEPHDDGRDLVLQRLRPIILVGLSAYFVFEFAEISIAYWNPTSHAPEMNLVLWGPYWWIFWVVHVALGGIAPFLLLISRRRALWVLAGVLLGTTFLTTRLNILIPGQAISELNGLQEAFQHPRLVYMYHATPMEYLVGLFLVAFGMTVFYVGSRISEMVEAKLDEKNPSERTEP